MLEGELIRQAIEDAVSRPEPRPGIIGGDSAWAERADYYLEGFGEMRPLGSGHFKIVP